MGILRQFLKSFFTVSRAKRNPSTTEGSTMEGEKYTSLGRIVLAVSDNFPFLLYCAFSIIRIKHLMILSFPEGSNGSRKPSSGVLKPLKIVV